LALFLYRKDQIDILVTPVGFDSLGRASDTKTSANRNLGVEDDELRDKLELRGSLVMHA
jgi:hypothetical protein